jgi:hypothetical protein
MAQTNAQRQAAFKARHLKSADCPVERIDCLIEAHAKAALKRLALHHGLPQWEMLQKLIGDAESALVDTLGTAAQTNYFAEKAKKPATR